MKTKVEPRPLYTILPDGRWDFYLDNSTLKDYTMCGQYFDYRHMQLLKQRGKGNLAMGIGSWWSLALEKIYLKIQTDHSITLPECQMLSANAWNELKMFEFEKEHPKQFHAFGEHFGAIKMIDDFYASHIQNDIKTYKIISAEGGFGLKGEVLVGENQSVVVHWVGKPDLTVLEGRRYSPFDHKSVSRIDGDIHGKYKPSPQIAGYIFATKLLANEVGLDVSVDRAIINVCARQAPSEKPRDGKKKPRFVRVIVTYTESEIAEWQRKTVEKVTALRASIENFVFLQNEVMCSSMYYQPCPFRGLCSNPPNSRQAIIQGNFDKAERWIPYQVEEEGDESE